MTFPERFYSRCPVIMDMLIKKDLPEYLLSINKEKSTVR